MPEQESAAAAIEVTLCCDGWTMTCADIALIAERAARAVLIHTGIENSPLVLDIRLTDDAEQQQLNRQYRGKDAPTNVLSFSATDPDLTPLPGMPLLLGDIVLAFETVQREAAAQEKAFADHVRHLVVHGVLHLLGFDHEDEGEAKLMETLEIEILASTGVPDPYRDTM